MSCGILASRLNVYREVVERGAIYLCKVNDRVWSG